VHLNSILFDQIIIATIKVKNDAGFEEEQQIQLVQLVFTKFQFFFLL
jgi:hypothetical protein